MKWFTIEAHKAVEISGPAWNVALDEYRDHLDAIRDRLPADLATLALDPGYHLHDAELRQVALDRSIRTVEMDLYITDGRQLHLSFGGARLLGGDLAMLRNIVGTTAGSRAYTEVCDQEIDLAADGRFVLRLELFSDAEDLTEFAVEFDTCALTCRDMTPAELSGRWDQARPGELVF
jgi:hypothetical protein